MWTLKKLPVDQLLGAVVEVPEALAETALHLEGVHDGVDAPDVLGVQLDRLPPDVLAPVVVTGLLETEGEHSEHERVVLFVRRPGREHAGDAVPQARGVAGEEVDLMADGEGERVERVPVGDLLQQLAASDHVPVQPDCRRLEVPPFPVVQAGLVDAGQPARQRLARRRHVVRLGAEDAEIALQRPAHRKVGLDLERPGGLVRDRGAEVQEGGHGGVEVADRLGTPRQWHAMTVEGHS